MKFKICMKEVLKERSTLRFLHLISVKIRF